MVAETFQKEFAISSSKRTELIDITKEVERIVSGTGVSNGLCVVFVPHATAAVILNENESGLVTDMETHIEKNFPAGAGYAHDQIDDNAASHVASALIGQSRTIPINSGKLIRGTWQNIFVIELDGPRKSRSVVVTIIGQ